ncbi:MAG TPA: hypothetical protein VFP87_16000 [Chitinophagaceae bacterium]|nr:hypothetical protein [Chitinophagaceae bacterium]
MTKILLILWLLSTASYSEAQKTPCTSDPVYRQFDFWIGEWDVYSRTGKKAGDSKIELILDSCIILENWKSASERTGMYYSGKSFNTYNAATRQWQQTWVDNVGGTTEFLVGHYESNKMIFLTKPFRVNKDTLAIRRLTFYNLEPNRVRQHAEISMDNGSTWITEYDLEYRRKKA